MRQRILGSISILLAGAGLAMAQPMPVGPEVKEAAPAPVEASGTLPATFKQGGHGHAGHDQLGYGVATKGYVGGACDPCATCEVAEARPYHMTNRFWISAEYLGWWLKDQRVPQPLLTTSVGLAETEDETVAGTLGSPGTRVLFGEGELGVSMFSGGRLTAGFVVDDHRHCAFEASAFAFGDRGGDFKAVSDPTGLPILGRPIFRPETNTEAVFLIAFPDAFAGGMIVDWRTQFWGAETNVICNAFNAGCVSFDLLVGARYLDLDENFRITDVSQVLGGGVGFFNGQAVDVGNTLAKRDIFETSNSFYGGQLGARLEYRGENFYVLAKAKVALGVTQEELRIDGASSVTAGGFIQSVPGGLFAASSNIGRYERDVFAVAPEVGVNLGLAVSRSCRIFAGYSFTYLSSVARPAEQVDRSVNLGLIPTSPSFGTSANPASPRAIFQSTDFWAHGINVGAAFRF